MSKHRSHLFLIKIGLLVVLPLIAIIVVGVAALWSVSRAQTNYQQSMENWKTTFTTAYTNAGQSLASSKDLNAVLMSLTNLQVALKSWSVPPEPTFAGISLLSSEQKQSRAAATQQAQKTSATVDDAQALMSYEVHVAAAFIPVNNPKIDNLEELKSLANAWGTAAAGFAALTPPPAAQSIQQKFGQALGTVTTTLATLVRLYQQQDGSGFNAERPTLSTALDAFQKVDNEFITLAQTQDTVLTAQLQSMTTALSDY